jgi:hypothetical protein
VCTALTWVVYFIEPPSAPGLDLSFRAEPKIHVSAVIEQGCWQFAVKGQPASELLQRIPPESSDCFNVGRAVTQHRGPESDWLLARELQSAMAPACGLSRHLEGGPLSTS